MKENKELHVWLTDQNDDLKFDNSYTAVSTALQNEHSIINTYLTWFCNKEVADLGYRVIIHWQDGSAEDVTDAIVTSDECKMDNAILNGVLHAVYNPVNVEGRKLFVIRDESIREKVKNL